MALYKSIYLLTVYNVRNMAAAYNAASINVAHYKCTDYYYYTSYPGTRYKDKRLAVLLKFPQSWLWRFLFSFPLGSMDVPGELTRYDWINMLVTAFMPKIVCYIERFIYCSLVVSPEMTCKTDQMSVRAFVRLSVRTVSTLFEIGLRDS